MIEKTKEPLIPTLSPQERGEGAGAAPRQNELMTR